MKRSTKPPWDATLESEAINETSSYESLEVTELFCPRCRQATPVRKRLLLVLPSGNKYDYLCSRCGTSVGSKTDDDETAFSILGPAPGM